MIKSRYLYRTPSHVQSNQDVRNAARGLFLHYKDWLQGAREAQSYAFSHMHAQFLLCP